MRLNKRLLIKHTHTYHESCYGALPEVELHSYDERYNMQNAEQLQSVVFFLSDHLCSAIDVSEELFGLRFASENMNSDLTSEDILDRLDEFHQFLDEIRTYEFLLLTKINQARHWCIHLRQLDRDLRPVIDLFNSATSSVAKIEQVLGIDEQNVFDGEGSAQHLIESRNLVTESATETNAANKNLS